MPKKNIMLRLPKRIEVPVIYTALEANRARFNLREQMLILALAEAQKLIEFEPIDQDIDIVLRVRCV